MTPLTCKNLSYMIDGKTLLAPVDLTLSPGRLIGIVGPNGAGKTTLLRLLVGLADPTTGSVSLGGKDLRQLSAEDRARTIAWLGSREQPVFSFSVADVVAMGRFASHRGTPGAGDRRAVKDALAQLGMAAFSDRDITTLSDGERQKVRLARCLAADTPVLLCDEPLAALDLQARVLCLQELRRKAQSGATVCLSIHDLNLAMQACDELICIDQGQVKNQGLPEKVLSPTALQEIFHTDAKLESTPSGQRTVTFFFPKDDGKP